MDTRLLESIGFTKGEVKVYFSLLKLGDTTIGPLSKSANVTPAKTYDILNKLKQKGLVTSVIKRDATHFQAFNPNRILDYLEEKKKRIADEQKQIREILPSIIAAQTAKQSATVYESLNGITALYDELLNELVKTKQDFLGFTFGEEYEDENVSRFFKSYDTKRLAEGIKTKLISIESQRARIERKFGKSKAVEIRYVEHAVPTGVVIVGTRVATLVWKPTPAAFVIDSPTVALAYKEFFNALWKKAKP